MIFSIEHDHHEGGKDDKEGILYQRKSTQKCYFIYYTGKVDENGKRERPWIDLHTTDKAAAKEIVKNIRADLAKKADMIHPLNKPLANGLIFG